MAKSNHSSESDPGISFSISDRLKQAEEDLGKTRQPENNPSEEPKEENAGRKTHLPKIQLEPEMMPTLDTQNELSDEMSESDTQKEVPALNPPQTEKKNEPEEAESKLLFQPPPEETGEIEVNVVNTFTNLPAPSKAPIEQSQILDPEATPLEVNPAAETAEELPKKSVDMSTVNTVIGNKPEFHSSQAQNPSDILDQQNKPPEKKEIKKSSGKFSRELDKRYELMGQVGQGGMGLIRSVEDKNLNRTLAMKILSPKYVKDQSIVDAFLEEASITAQLQHPNIIPVHDIGILPESDNHFYTMKLVDGNSLQDVIDKLKENDPEYIKEYNLYNMLSIFKKVCDAVAYAHSKGIIHRDIKPGNIMVGQFGEVLLLDWGLAKYSGATEEIDIKKKLEETNHDQPLMTMDGIIKGSLAYLSPEQAHGEIKDIDHVTDVFLLGATLYHMLTLEPPYSNKNMVEIIRRAETADFTHPNDTERGKGIPEALVNIINKSMAADKSVRFQSAQELSQKIDDYIQGRNVSQLKTYQKGELLIEDKDLGDDTFIIISGKVDISRVIDGKETHLETLGRGAVFGELAALTHDIRTAQAKAAENTEVMIISKQLMFDEIRKLPPWLEKIVFNLASKVSAMNERIHPFILSNCSLPVLKQLLYLFSIVNSNPENQKTVAIDYEGVIHEISQNLGISTSRIEEVLQVLEEFKLSEKDGSNRYCITNMDDLKNLIAYIKREQNITEGIGYSLDEISIQKIPLLDEIYQRMATLHY